MATSAPIPPDDPAAAVAATGASPRQRLLDTVAHEFFHCWNVERIRAPLVWTTYGVRGEGIGATTVHLSSVPS